MLNKKRLKLVVILLVTVLLFSINILVPHVKTAENQSTTGSFCVSTNGSDIYGDGSFNNPWRTIQKAASVVSSGDTVYIRAGTYYEEVIIGNKNGGDNQWITFMPYDNEEVIIDGRNVKPDYYHAIFYIHDSSYICITGLKILNSAYGGVHIQNKATHHIRIDNNIIRNCSARGIATFADGFILENLTIEYNTVDFVINNWKGVGGNAGEAISLGNVKNFNIGYNHVSRSGKECIDLKDGCSYGTVHHNKIDTSSVPRGFNEDYNHIGIYIEPGSKKGQNIEVYSNLIYGGHGGGIWICPEGSGGSAENIKVYNNILNLTWDIGNGMGCFDNSYGNAIFKHIYFYSNTVYTTWLPFKITAKQNLITDIQVKNNIFTAKNNALTLYCPEIKYFDNVINISSNLFHNYVGKTWSKWNDMEGGSIGFGTKAILSDPNFVKTSNPCDLSINIDSPAIDNGTEELASQMDYNGIKRPQNGKYDIGAYEYYTDDADIVDNTIPPIDNNDELNLEDNTTVPSIDDVNITSNNSTSPTVGDEIGLGGNNTISPIDTNETNTTNTSMPSADNDEFYSEDTTIIPQVDNEVTNAEDNDVPPTNNNAVQSVNTITSPMAHSTEAKSEDNDVSPTDNNVVNSEDAIAINITDNYEEDVPSDTECNVEVSKSQDNKSNLITELGKTFYVINLNPVLHGILFFHILLFKLLLWT